MSNAHEIKIKITKKGKVFRLVEKSCRTVLNIVKPVAQMQIMPHPHRIFPAQPNPENPAKEAREATTTSNAHEVEIRKTKESKEQYDMSLFCKLHDEQVSNILSIYRDLDDIDGTRVWPSKEVQHFTETTWKRTSYRIW